MSRSYKRSPVRKASTKGMKKVANRSLRRNEKEMANGKAYKKFFPSYDICDYYARYSFQEYLAWRKKINNWRKSRGFSTKEKTEEELFREWKKQYYFK